MLVCVTIWLIMSPVKQLKGFNWCFDVLCSSSLAWFIFHNVFSTSGLNVPWIKNSIPINVHSFLCITKLKVWLLRWQTLVLTLIQNLIQTFKFFLSRQFSFFFHHFNQCHCFLLIVPRNQLTFSVRLLLFLLSLFSCHYHCSPQNRYLYCLLHQTHAPKITLHLRRDHHKTVEVNRLFVVWKQTFFLVSKPYYNKFTQIYQNIKFYSTVAFL